MTNVRGITISPSASFDVLLRVVLAILFVTLENVEPFSRKIHEDELWLYRNPPTESYVPTTILWPLVFLAPVAVIFITFLMHRDKSDLCQAILALTLGLGINGVLTDVIKLIVGRPRPDFFWRCFPDGQSNPEFRCTGNPAIVKDGRKSFPSGHSSFAFAGFGFIALYTAGKFHTFSLAGKGQSWKLCVFVTMMGIALVIALSRTCDYHHHWQDVTVGSAIGCITTYVCYRHYYPSLDSQLCHKPYTSIFQQVKMEKNKKSIKEEQIKWI